MGTKQRFTTAEQQLHWLFLIDEDKGLTEGRKIANSFSSYGIFQPNTMTLRGMIPDPNQMTPIGLNGGRLAEVLQDLIKEKDEELLFGFLYMEDVLELIDWASEITVDVPKKKSINSNIPTTRQVIEFTDRFMKDTAKFTGYDASEGALYVLFMLTLAMRPKGPSIFSVDSFDVDRDENGFAQITRVKVSQELIDAGQPLSRLWINGRLGGVPTII